MLSGASSASAINIGAGVTGAATHSPNICQKGGLIFNYREL